ncbi:Cut9-interacting protein scn1 [Microbotryomycetes sp. JL201]|nr:Cut9-interacting protein scn1 [Microbotryomycetes sp. JL201]
MVGEVGLDKAFRIPNPPPAIQDGQLRPKNSDLQTPVRHQLAIVKAQIKVAVRLKRHVSLHCVRAAGETVALLGWCKKELSEFERIHVCLHSFGGSPESAIQIQKNHCNVYFSFSTAISGRSPRFFDLMRSIEAHRLLVESDYSDSSKLDEQASLVWQVFSAMAQAREWSHEHLASLLEGNWTSFLRVDDVPEDAHLTKKQRKIQQKIRAIESTIGDA